MLSIFRKTKSVFGMSGRMKMETLVGFMVPSGLIGKNRMGPVQLTKSMKLFTQFEIIQIVDGI